MHSWAYGARSPPACEELEVRTVHRGLHNYLIPWIRTPLENLIFPQLVKKFPEFYGTWRFLTLLHNSSPPILTLSQINPLYALFLSLKIHSILSLLSTFKSSKCLFLPGFSPNPSIYLPSPHTCHLILFGLAIRIEFGDVYRQWSCSLCMQSLPVPRTSFLFGPNIFFSPLFSNTLTFFLPLCERPRLKPISNKRQNYSSVYFNLCIFDSAMEEYNSGANVPRHSKRSTCS